MNLLNLFNYISDHMVVHSLVVLQVVQLLSVRLIIYLVMCALYIIRNDLLHVTNLVVVVDLVRNLILVITLGLYICACVTTSARFVTRVGANGLILKNIFVSATWVRNRFDVDNATCHLVHAAT